MKRLAIIIVMAFSSLCITSCHFGHHSTIIETGNNYYLRIEYAGRIYFNNEGTAISEISRNGYVKYQFNEKKLEAKNDGHGGVTYELYDNGEQLTPGTDGRQFIAEAVRMMLKKNHRANW